MFTVTTDGKWTYAIDQSKTDWFTHPTVDGMTLAILIPENTVSRERSGVVRFISVSDPTLVEEFTITQEPGPVPPEAPKADLLDVVFHADGTAEDVSPLKNEVLSYPGTALTCYYHDVYKRIVTNYTHTPGQGSRKDSYYRVDYYTNETFKQGLDDGHTLEVVLRSNRNDGTKEYKPFSAHEAGGTGFLICKEGQGGHPACITFLPNVSTTGKSTWRWAQSDVTPEPGRYYHVVGVWDKTAEKAYIYVDGQLKGTADAPGELIHAKDGARWFALGGDSAVGSMGNAWNGEVVLARVFDDALTGDQIALLYQDAAFAGQTPVEFALSNLAYLTRCEIGAGYTYTIYGNGFAAGDKVKFTSAANVTAAFTADAAFTEASGDNTLQSLAVTLPAGIPAGTNRYFMTLVRNGSQYPIGTVEFTVCDNPSVSMPRIIAHRGQHQDGVENSTENSIAALTNAQKLGIHGAEFDVWITDDDVPVINHNATVAGSDLRQGRFDETDLRNQDPQFGRKQHAGRQRRRGRRQGEVDGDAGRLHRLRLRGLQAAPGGHARGRRTVSGRRQGSCRSRGGQALGHRLPVFDRAFEKTRVGDGSPRRRNRGQRLDGQFDGRHDGLHRAGCRLHHHRQPRHAEKTAGDTVRHSPEITAEAPFRISGFTGRTIVRPAFFAESAFFY